MLGEEGAAIVEATIVAPILVVMGIYAADFGLLFYNKMEMQNAAQAGAQWALANRVYNCGSISTAAQNATYTPLTPRCENWLGGLCGNFL
jgi:Flp pilus assembly protein TadG